jgi:hypothetical protein
MFSEVAIFCQDIDIFGLEYHWHAPPAFCQLLRIRQLWKRPQHNAVFEMLCEIRKIRDFKLVLYADVWGFLTECAVRELEWGVAEQVKGGLGDLSSRLLVTSSPREFLPAPDEPVGSNVLFSKWVHSWAPRSERRQSDGPTYYHRSLEGRARPAITLRPLRYSHY